MLKKLCLLLVFVTDVGICEDQQKRLYPAIDHEKSWIYSNIQDIRRNITIYFNPSAVALGDVVRDGYVCDAESNFHCVESEEMIFAVPKTDNILPPFWMYKTEKFEVMSNASYEIFGLLENIITIQSKQGDSHLQFLFSEKRGLIGFGTIKTITSGLFLLNGRCGLGAPSSCFE